MVVDILAATTVVPEGHSSRAMDILATTTVVLQGHSSRTDAKSRAVRNIDFECRATLLLREESKRLFLVFILQYCILWVGRSS